MVAKNRSSGNVTALGTFLRERGALVDSNGNRVGDVRAFSETDDIESLWRIGSATANELADAVAVFHGLPRTSFAAIASHEPLFRDLSRRYLREAFIYPYDGNGTPTLA